MHIYVTFEMASWLAEQLITRKLFIWDLDENGPLFIVRPMDHRDPCLLYMVHDQGHEQELLSQNFTFQTYEAVKLSSNEKKLLFLNVSDLSNYSYI